MPQYMTPSLYNPDQEMMQTPVSFSPKILSNNTHEFDTRKERHPSMEFNRLRLAVILILLCGVGLRLALYDIHGLEGDDGVALVLTHYDVPTLVDGLLRQELDVHPPLY